MFENILADSQLVPAENLFPRFGEKLHLTGDTAIALFIGHT